MIEPNRRHFARRNTEGVIQVLIVPPYSKDRENDCNLIPAIILNLSEEGLYLETNRALQPGSNVTIRIDGPEGRLHSKDVYYMRDGRIIWCKKVDDETSRFGTGVKILRKAVQANILTSRFGPSAWRSPPNK